MLDEQFKTLEHLKLSIQYNLLKHSLHQNTCATEQWKKGTVIEDISKLMNTSQRMVMSVYLGNSDEVLIKLHKRIPNNFKVLK